MTNESRILCYSLGFVYLVFTVIIHNKPRILILILVVGQSWLLWQQAVVKILHFAIFHLLKGISRVTVGKISSNLAL